MGFPYKFTGMVGVPGPREIVDGCKEKDYNSAKQRSADLLVAKSQLMATGDDSPGK